MMSLPANLDDDPQIVVMDGGFSTQLSCHVGEIVDGDPLWSARFTATHPEDVIETHLDFLRAGAELIMTNTYQASIDGFMRHLFLDRVQSINLIKQSVCLANIARERYVNDYPHYGQPKPLIVGSVGPYGASLHDGSEYTGNYHDKVSKETLKEWHIPRIDALIEAGVDMLGLETIPCVAEAEVLLDILKMYPNMKAWLTFSCKDETFISNGENFQRAVRHCWDLNPNQLVALGVNCIGPKYVESLFKGINKGREQNPIPLIVYPNSGENYDLKLGWIDRDKCEPVGRYVETWLDLGVTWIGGCCRTNALDIKRIRNEVSKWRLSRPE